VFQSYNLVPVLNVYENIVRPIELDGNKVDEGFVTQIIATLGLTEKKHSLPSQLSGGQQQRVAIARALVTKPAIVLADEPTGNLDSKTSMDVIGLLKVSGEKFGQTIVMITHNVEIAQMANRIIRIEDGRIVSVGGMSRAASLSGGDTPRTTTLSGAASPQMRKPTQSDNARQDSRGDSHA
jgi:putative ABC transport system ATP-binding protein